MTSRKTPASLAALALAAGAAAAGAADVAPSDNANPAAATQSAQAVRAVRDKETGKLRAPRDAELAAILEEERVARQAQGLPEPTGPVAPVTVRQHGGGMVSAVLGPEYLVTVRAQRRPDGKLVVSHTHPAHEHPAVAPQPPTE